MKEALLMSPSRQRLALAGMMICLAATVGCSRQGTPRSASAKVRIENAPGPEVVTVPNPGLFKLVPAEARLLKNQLSVPGVVAPDVARTVHVTSLASGRALEIRAKLGDQVQKGQVLMVVHSPDLASAINAYQKSLADQKLVHAALVRAQALYQHGAIALKDLEQAEDDDQKASVDVDTNAQQIRILGGNLDHLSSTIEIKAPVPGVIVEQNTAGGETVAAGNSVSLFTIADLSEVWVLASVYENDLAGVQVGDLAKVTLNAYPDMKLEGWVSNISGVLDPSTRSASVRVALANPGLRMRPGMYASVEFISQRRRQTVLVPTSAIFRLHDTSWVFVPEGGNQFRRVAVNTGIVTPGNLQEILSGLAPNQPVVADALQFASAAGEE
jgi:cobalt-zinc-cadmium efflux system membrane fusion protein